MDWCPLFDIPTAIADADQALADIFSYVEHAHAQTDGTHPDPEDAAALLANVAALRELLALVLQPRLTAAIALERQSYDADMAQWEALGS